MSALQYSGPVFEQRLKTPQGEMIAMASDSGLLLLEFHDRRDLPGQRRRLFSALGIDGADSAAVLSRKNAVLMQLQSELREYFAGQRQHFSVPLHEPVPGTAFQRAIWAELARIPFGQTRSYSDLAHAVERPGAVRAVGAANGANRMAIVLPCHRVIGKSGTLTGYAGGLARKRWLLAHEGVAGSETI